MHLSDFSFVISSFFFLFHRFHNVKIKKQPPIYLIRATVIISFTITNMLQKNQLLTNYMFTMKKITFISIL